MANKFRKGDKVTITVGKDKGKSGTITQVFPAEHKIIVEGVNKVKKHVKPTQQEPKGSIVEKELPFNWSKATHVGEDGKPFKIGFKILENGKKVRYDRRTGSQIDQ